MTHWEVTHTYMYAVVVKGDQVVTPTRLDGGAPVSVG